MASKNQNGVNCYFLSNQRLERHLSGKPKTIFGCNSLSIYYIGPKKIEPFKCYRGNPRRRQNSKKNLFWLPNGQFKSIFSPKIDLNDLCRHLGF
jgi:hypothetical protein